MSATATPVLSIKLDPKFTKAVADGFDEKGIALREAERRRQLYRQGCDQCERDEAELKRVSKNLLPTDDAAIVRAATLKLKLELWPNRNVELERDRLLAEERAQFADSKIKAALADAASQIIEARKEFVRRLLEPLRDPGFSEFVIPRAPLVSEAERFKAACNGDLERTIGLPVEQIAETVLRGEIPPLPSLGNPLQNAALVHLSNLPLPNY